MTTAAQQPVTLDDGVVRLRPWRPDDWPALYAACQAPDIQRWTSVPSPYTAQDARAFVGELSPAGWAAGTELSFAVVTGDDTPVAAVGLGVHRSRVLGAVGEVGYWAAPPVRGRGLVTRAVRLVCGFGFDELGLGRIEWQAEVGNGASRRVAERAGFRVEGTARQRPSHRGRRVDGWFGALLPGDPRVGTPVEPMSPAMLTTARLDVRPLTDADAPAVARGCGDPEVLRWLTALPAPYTIADAAAFLRRQAAAPWDGEAHHAIVDRVTGDLVGVIGVFDLERRARQAEVGYWVAAPVRGRGYATEALLAVRDWAFDVVGLHRLVLTADVGNAGSRRVAERAGFRLEGVLRERAVDRSGARRDIATYAAIATGRVAAAAAGR